MTIVFEANEVKDSPEAFPGVVLKSFIHPDPQYHDGYNSQQYGTPEVAFSFGLFTLEPYAQWPATRFDITEVSYVLEGKGIFICDGKEHRVKAGSVIYIPKGEVRVIKNTTERPLKYLCIVDPAWQPAYEHVL